MLGNFYMDRIGPFISADVSSVTLATTAKALYPAANFPPGIGANYFNRYPGSSIHIRLFGRITTAATPGNGSFDIYYGTGGDANGTILASSAALALTASQTNLSWKLDLDIHSRTMGSSGTLFCTGDAEFNVGVLASTLAPMLIPASAPAVSSAIDLTSVSSIISVQFKRSGNTAETMQVHELKIWCEN